MKSIADILQKFSPTEDKYVSREYQSFGIFLADKLGDQKRKGLYIRYAKVIPRPILQKAYSFVIDSKARNMGALFMWKLKEMGVFEKFKLDPMVKKKKPQQAKAKDAGVQKKPTRKKKTSSNVLEDELF